MTSSASAQANARFPLWLLICASLTAIAPLSIDMYLPSFPALAADLHTDIGRVQLTLGTFLVGLAIGQAFYGPVSDRYGRKAPLYAGLTIYGVAAAGCALASTVESQILLRLQKAHGGCNRKVV